MIARSNEAHVMRDAHSSNRLKWCHWSIVLAIVLVGITSVSTVWHVVHGVDQDCAVCQSRHQPAADFSEAPPIATVDEPEPVRQAQTPAWTASDHDSGIPIRAPPA